MHKPALFLFIAAAFLFCMPPAAASGFCAPESPLPCTLEADGAPAAGAAENTAADVLRRPGSDEPVQADSSAGASERAGPGIADVGSDIPIYEADNEQYMPAVAYNTRHDEYLVVWYNKWGDGGRDIYARRVSGRGRLLSSFPVSCSTAALPNDRAQPSVAYDPHFDRYLVVWIYDAAGDQSNWDLYGRFIPWDGPELCGEEEFPICTCSSIQWAPEVVVNEDPAWPEFLVVWYNVPVSGSCGKNYICARRVCADGSGFPHPEGFIVAWDSTCSHHYLSPDAAYNLARNEYLVVYSRDQQDILATRLTANGCILGKGPIEIAGWPEAEKHPSAAACHTENQYLVAWQSWHSGSPYHSDIDARFVSGAGTPGTVLHPARTSINEALPEVACSPEERHYFVVWEEQHGGSYGPYGVSGRLVHTDGSFEEDVDIVSPYSGAERTRPEVSAGETAYLAAWEHERYGTPYQDIHGRLVRHQAVPLPWIPLLLLN